MLIVGLAGALLVPQERVRSQEREKTPTTAPGQTTRLPPHITPATKDAIDRGLAYLARTQDRQGSWSNIGQFGAYPVAMTSLAGIALLMDGNTTTQGRYAPQVDRATDFLLRSAGANGLIAGGREESRPMFGHGFAMLFLSQLYGMTEDTTRAKQIRDVLDRSVALTGRSQSDLGGWIYTPDQNADEGSVTITQVQALRSCRNAGISVPKEIIDRAMKYLADSQNSDGGIRYTLRQRGGGSRAPITGAAVLCWYLAGEYTNPLAKRALEYSKNTIKPGSMHPGHDYYAHLYFSQALYVSSDPYWDEYFPKRRDYFLAQQQADGYWVGDGVGDIFGTAVALTVLQLPFEQLPIMQK